MASTTKMGKKVISQNELRRIMNEQKMKLTQTTKRIESPLARYTAKGQLSCILCDAPVKNEGMWTAHLASKQHLANISAAKKKRSEMEGTKRPAAPAVSMAAPPEKRQKNNSAEAPASSTNAAIPSDFFDAPIKTPAAVKSEKWVSPSPKKEVPRQVKNAEPTSSRGANALAVSSKSKSNASAAPDEEADENSEVLPEGFFDDPKLDAKVRNVEYKDPVEEEWDKFMKEMKTQSEQSHQIIQDDQEEATAERQLEEIDEQMRNWSRVIDLEKKMEEVETKTAAAEKIKKENQSDSDSEDGDDFDEFLDWRAKHS